MRAPRERVHLRIKQPVDKYICTSSNHSSRACTHLLLHAILLVTKQILSQEPSRDLGSDLGDDGELEGLDADPGMGGRLFGAAAARLLPGLSS